MIQKKMKVGLLGVGLDTYWGQFEGLLPRLLAYQQEICEGIERMDIEVVNVGMVDSPSKAMESALLLRQATYIFIYLYLCSFIYGFACCQGSWKTCYNVECTANSVY